MSFLIVNNITKTFDESYDKVSYALDDISFNVEKGEFLSILGPSGCGKTTLLRIIIGLLKADKGSIVLDGRDITNFSPGDREMGIVFQNYALFENMTVLQNVSYALKLKKETKENAEKIAYDMICKMGLKDHISKKPKELSGGQQQRVAIARTLVLKPRIVLLDEPMSALDVATRLALRKELKKIQNEYNISMIYITHDQEEAFALSDRIIVMEKSKIVQIGTPDEIIDNPANEYVQSFVIDNLQIKIDSLKRFVRDK